MWLELERGIARDLRRRLRIDVADPHPGQPGLRSLVLEAAHTFLPEAALEGLPAIAQTEVEVGFTGPLREAIAAAEPNEEAVQPLRDLVVEGLTGMHGSVGALLLVDQIHLRRLVRGNVPVIVAVRCVHWYCSYRTTDDPDARLVASLLALDYEWLRSRKDRPRLEEAMRAEAVSLVGEQPDDLLNVTV